MYWPNNITITSYGEKAIQSWEEIKGLKANLILLQLVNSPAAWSSVVMIQARERVYDRETATVPKGDPREKTYFLFRRIKYKAIDKSH